MSNLSVLEKKASYYFVEKTSIVNFLINVKGVYNIQTLFAIRYAIFVAFSKVIHLNYKTALKLKLYDSKNPTVSTLLSYLETSSKNTVCDELLVEEDPHAFDKTFVLLDNIFNTHFQVKSRITKLPQGAPISVLTSPHVDKRGQEQFKKIEFKLQMNLDLSRACESDSYQGDVTESEKLYHEFLIKKIPSILDTVGKLYGASITYSTEYHTNK